MRKNIRNIGLIGKDGSGKTKLAEAMLFVSDTIKEMGKTSKGNTVLDFEAVEKKRGFSLKSSIANMKWKKETYNIIDTPAFNAFMFDTKCSIQAMDMALLVISANEDLASQSRYIWELTQQRRIPSMGVLTHLDKEDSNFEAVLESIETKLGKKPLVLQVPYGEKSEFKGFIDLIKNKLYEFDDTGKFDIKDIPADYAEKVEEARMEMLEEVSMVNDDLTEKFMEEENLTPEETEAALKEGFAKGEFFPLVIANGHNNLGVKRLLNLIGHLLPAPVLKDDYTAKKGEEEIVVSSDLDYFSALVFNTMIDPFLGNVSILKVISGTLKAGKEIYNPNTDTVERVGNLSVVRGKALIPIDEAVAGDIVAITKLKNTHTGNTLVESSKKTFILDFIPKAEPVIQYSLTVESKKDEDKLGSVMQRIMEADPSIQIIQDSEMHQLLLAGQGQMQLQTMLDEVQEKYKIKINLSKPKVQYRETIKGKAEAQGKYKKQSGGKGQYGDCHIRVKPAPRGRGFVFVDKIVGGVIPKTFIPSVEKGIKDACKTGVLKGYPTIDFEVELFYGSYHDVDSSDRAFQVAGSMAFKKVMPEATPIILEPYMNLDIFIDEDLVGTIAGDISSRRGRINAFDDVDGGKAVRVTIPQVEILEYETVLNQLTSGSGRFAVEFSHYEEFRGDLSDIPQNGGE